jgi:alpha,alpha-trehalase
MARDDIFDELTPERVKPALDYIEAYWPQLTKLQVHDEGTLVGLPKPYITPSIRNGTGFNYEEQYYWDSYFIAQGLLAAGHGELAAGMLQNLIAMLNRFDMIPTANRTYLTGRSQPPFLTSYILDIYRALEKSTKWLQTNMNLAKEEYRTVWLGTEHPHWRRVYKGLSRYYDINLLHDLAEAESGWDMTTLFSRKCLHYLPVDLNALLYKYETDFAVAAQLLGDNEEAQAWLDRASTRKDTMFALMWDKQQHFFFDYNHVKERRGRVWSLAGYVPLWAGMLDADQADRLVRNLRHFEQKGGLAATARQTWVISQIPAQWAYPNSWAPLEYMVVEGLKRYGYHADAERVARTWLLNCLKYFERHGIFIEKYNVSNPDKLPENGLYPLQTGFGWTNAVFVKFCHDFLNN